MDKTLKYAILFILLPALALTSLLFFTREPTYEVAAKGKRVALVIGNSAYQEPRPHAAADAKDLASALASLGYDVLLCRDADVELMHRAMGEFRMRLNEAAVGLFYFSGHAMQYDNNNYLVPVGVQGTRPDDFKLQSLDIARVENAMSQALEDAEDDQSRRQRKVVLVMLDVGRDPRFAAHQNTHKGISILEAQRKAFVAFARNPTEPAPTGPPAGQDKSNSRFMEALLTEISRDEVTIVQIMNRVRRVMKEERKERGEEKDKPGKITFPYYSSAIEGMFRLRRPEAKLGGLVTELRPHVEPVPSQGDVFADPYTDMEFVWIDENCYQMGSPPGEAGREPYEGPRHRVCLDGFWMGRFEVTNDQFRRFRPDHHSGSYQGHTLNAGNQPVVNVSWEDARDYAAWMTKKSFGRFVYSLPSEAQWEYAARAGTSAPRFWGHDPGKACLYANAADLTLRRATGATAIHPCEDGHTATAPVGSFRPNPFGLYDMLGNVYEWTADVWSPEAYHRHTPRNPVYLGRGFERVYRGGGWNESPASVRCAFRFRAKQDLRNMPLGFRLIRKASY